MSGSEVEVGEDLARIKRRAAKFLRSIRLDNRENFSMYIEEGIDVNYTDENNNLPIQAAIVYVNDYAFEKLLKHPTFDIKKISFHKWGPLASAASNGHERYLQMLLDYDPRPDAAKAYYGFTLLSAALEGMDSYAILEYSSFNTEDPRTHGNNAGLKQELSDFFHQKGKYAKELDEYGGVPEKGIPFQGSLSKPLQALYLGKPEILGLLLSKGANPTLPASGTDRSALAFVENPVKYARYPQGDEEEQVRYLGDEGNGILKYSMKLHNRARDCAPIDIIVYYDTNPSKKVILGFQQQLSERERETVEVLSKKVEDDVAMGHERIERKVRDETDRIDRGLYYLDHRVEMNGMAVQSLAYSAQPAILASQEEILWRSRREGIKVYKLAETFCVAVDLGLRANVAASIVLSSGKVERASGLGESILTGAIEVIGDHVPMFGGIIKLIARGVETGFDWHADKLNKATARLFAFVRVEEICDRMAIEITESCMHLFKTDIIKNEKHAEKLAKNALALVLYTMSTSVIKPEQDLREQLVYYFTQSKLFEKYHREFVEYVVEREIERQPLVFSSSSVQPLVVTSSNGMVIVQPTNGMNGHAVTSVQDLNSDEAPKKSPCCVIL